MNTLEARRHVSTVFTHQQLLATNVTKDIDRFIDHRKTFGAAFGEPYLIWSIETATYRINPDGRWAAILDADFNLILYTSDEEVLMFTALIA